MVLPFSACLAISIAPASVAPPEIPTKMPSSVARARDSLSASAPLTGTMSSIVSAVAASSVSFGMKSGLQPCMRWGRNSGWLSTGLPSLSRSCGMPLPSVCELSGSHTTIRVSGRASLSTRDTPFSVPPVPNPVTQ